ncbi:hypothetical protein SNEBB_008113 [Seison nebaliae]|nr:hypothetical protein SNEBB_008113 [Seison nebaliae]
MTSLLRNKAHEKVKGSESLNSYGAKDLYGIALKREFHKVRGALNDTSVTSGLVRQQTVCQTLQQIYVEFKSTVLPDYFFSMFLDFGDLLYSKREYRIALTYCYEICVKNSQKNFLHAFYEELEETTNYNFQSDQFHSTVLEFEELISDPEISKLELRGMTGYILMKCYTLMASETSELNNGKSHGSFNNLYNDDIRKKVLNMMQLFRIIIELILKQNEIFRESLCWLINSIASHIYEIIKLFIDHGYGLELLNMSIWITISFGRFIVHQMPDYFQFISQLHCVTLHLLIKDGQLNVSEKFLTRGYEQLKLMYSLIEDEDKFSWSIRFREAVLRLTVYDFLLNCLNNTRKSIRMSMLKKPVDSKELGRNEVEKELENKLPEGGNAAQFMTLMVALQYLCDGNYSYFQSYGSGLPISKDSESQLLIDQMIEVAINLVREKTLKLTTERRLSYRKILHVQSSNLNVFNLSNVVPKLQENNFIGSISRSNLSIPILEVILLAKITFRFENYRNFLILKLSIVNFVVLSKMLPTQYIYSYLDMSMISNEAEMTNELDENESLSQSFPDCNKQILYNLVELELLNELAIYKKWLKDNKMLPQSILSNKLVTQGLLDLMQMDLSKDDKKMKKKISETTLLNSIEMILIRLYKLNLLKNEFFPIIDIDSNLLKDCLLFVTTNIDTILKNHIPIQQLPQIEWFRLIPDLDEWIVLLELLIYLMEEISLSSIDMELYLGITSRIAHLFQTLHFFHYTMEMKGNELKNILNKIRSTPINLFSNTVNMTTYQIYHRNSLTALYNAIVNLNSFKFQNSKLEYISSNLFRKLKFNESYLTLNGKLIINNDDIQIYDIFNDISNGFEENDNLESKLLNILLSSSYVCDISWHKIFMNIALHFDEWNKVKNSKEKEKFSKSEPQSPKERSMSIAPKLSDGEGTTNLQATSLQLLQKIVNQTNEIVYSDNLAQQINDRFKWDTKERTHLILKIHEEFNTKINLNNIYEQYFLTLFTNILKLPEANEHHQISPAEQESNRISNITKLTKLLQRQIKASGTDKKLQLIIYSTYLIVLGELTKKYRVRIEKHNEQIKPILEKLSKLLEASEEEEWNLFQHSFCKYTKKFDVVRNSFHVPILRSSTNFKFFIIADLQGTKMNSTTHYAIYNREVDCEGVHALVSDDTFKGCGEMIPITIPTVTIHNVRPYQPYVQSIGFFSFENKNPINNLFNWPTISIPASAQLSSLKCYSLMCTATYKTQQLNHFKQPYLRLLDYFLEIPIKRSSNYTSHLTNHQIPLKCDKYVLGITPPSLIRCFIRNIFEYVELRSLRNCLKPYLLFGLPHNTQSHKLRLTLIDHLFLSFNLATFLNEQYFMIQQFFYMYLLIIPFIQKGSEHEKVKNVINQMITIYLVLPQGKQFFNVINNYPMTEHSSYIVSNNFESLENYLDAKTINSRNKNYLTYYNFFKNFTNSYLYMISIIIKYFIRIHQNEWQFYAQSDMGKRIIKTYTETIDQFKSFLTDEYKLISTPAPIEIIRFDVLTFSKEIIDFFDFSKNEPNINNYRLIIANYDPNQDKPMKNILKEINKLRRSGIYFHLLLSIFHKHFLNDNMDPLKSYIICILHMFKLKFEEYSKLNKIGKRSQINGVSKEDLGKNMTAFEEVLSPELIPIMKILNYRTPTKNDMTALGLTNDDLYIFFHNPVYPPTEIRNVSLTKVKMQSMATKYKQSKASFEKLRKYVRRHKYRKFARKINEINMKFNLLLADIDTYCLFALINGMSNYENKSKEQNNSINSTITPFYSTLNECTLLETYKNQLIDPSSSIKSSLSTDMVMTEKNENSTINILRTKFAGNNWQMSDAAKFIQLLWNSLGCDGDVVDNDLSLIRERPIMKPIGYECRLSISAVTMAVYNIFRCYLKISVLSYRYNDFKLLQNVSQLMLQKFNLISQLVSDLTFIAYKPSSKQTPKPKLHTILFTFKDFLNLTWKTWYLTADNLCDMLWNFILQLYPTDSDQPINFFTTLMRFTAAAPFGESSMFKEPFDIADKLFSTVTDQVSKLGGLTMNNLNDDNKKRIGSSNLFHNEMAIIYDIDWENFIHFSLFTIHLLLIKNKWEHVISLGLKFSFITRQHYDGTVLPIIIHAQQQIKNLILINQKSSSDGSSLNMYNYLYNDSFPFMLSYMEKMMILEVFQLMNPPRALMRKSHKVTKNKANKPSVEGDNSPTSSYYYGSSSGRTKPFFPILVGVPLNSKPLLERLKMVTSSFDTESIDMYKDSNCQFLPCPSQFTIIINDNVYSSENLKIISTKKLNWRPAKSPALASIMRKLSICRERYKFYLDQYQSMKQQQLAKNIIEEKTAKFLDVALSAYRQAMDCFNKSSLTFSGIKFQIMNEFAILKYHSKKYLEALQLWNLILDRILNLSNSSTKWLSLVDNEDDKEIIILVECYVAALRRNMSSSNMIKETNTFLQYLIVYAIFVVYHIGRYGGSNSSSHSLECYLLIGIISIILIQEENPLQPSNPLLYAGYNVFDCNRSKSIDKNLIANLKIFKNFSKISPTKFIHILLIVSNHLVNCKYFELVFPMLSLIEYLSIFITRQTSIYVQCRILRCRAAIELKLFSIAYDILVQLMTRKNIPRVIKWISPISIQIFNDDPSKIVHGPLPSINPKFPSLKDLNFDDKLKFSTPSNIHALEFLLSWTMQIELVEVLEYYNSIELQLLLIHFLISISATIVDPKSTSTDTDDLVDRTDLTISAQRTSKIGTKINKKRERNSNDITFLKDCIMEKCLVLITAQLNIFSVKPTKFGNLLTNYVNEDQVQKVQEQYLFSDTPPYLQNWIEFYYYIQLTIYYAQMYQELSMNFFSLQTIKRLLSKYDVCIQQLVENDPDPFELNKMKDTTSENSQSIKFTSIPWYPGTESEFNEKNDFYKFCLITNGEMWLNLKTLYIRYKMNDHKFMVNEMTAKSSAKQLMAVQHNTLFYCNSFIESEESKELSHGKYRLPIVYYYRARTLVNTGSTSTALTSILKGIEMLESIKLPSIYHQQILSMSYLLKVNLMTFISQYQLSIVESYENRLDGLNYIPIIKQSLNKSLKLELCSLMEYGRDVKLYENNQYYLSTPFTNENEIERYWTTIIDPFYHLIQTKLAMGRLKIGEFNNLPLKGIKLHLLFAQQFEHLSQIYKLWRQINRYMNETASIPFLIESEFHSFTWTLFSSILITFNQFASIDKSNNSELLKVEDSEAIKSISHLTLDEVIEISEKYTKFILENFPDYSFLRDIQHNIIAFYVRLYFFSEEEEKMMLFTGIEKYVEFLIEYQELNSQRSEIFSKEKEFFNRTEFEIMPYCLLANVYAIYYLFAPQTKYANKEEQEVLVHLPELRNVNDEKPFHLLQHLKLIKINLQKLYSKEETTPQLLLIDILEYLLNLSQHITLTKTTGIVPEKHSKFRKTERYIIPIVQSPHYHSVCLQLEDARRLHDVQLMAAISQLAKAREVKRQKSETNKKSNPSNSQITGSATAPTTTEGKSNKTKVSSRKSGKTSKTKKKKVKPKEKMDEKSQVGTEMNIRILVTRYIVTSLDVLSIIGYKRNDYLSLVILRSTDTNHTVDVIPMLKKDLFALQKRLDNLTKFVISEETEDTMENWCTDFYHAIVLTKLEEKGRNDLHKRYQKQMKNIQVLKTEPLELTEANINELQLILNPLSAYLNPNITKVGHWIINILSEVDEYLKK